MLTCTLEAQVLLAFSEPASPVTALCIQMAGTTKRLRQKTTVSQRPCGELMMLTYEWWMQILIPDLRCDDYKFNLHSSWESSFWLEWNGLRMLSKAWREVLERGVKIIMQFSYHEWTRYTDFRFWCAPCYDEVEFVRDSCRVLDGRQRQ